MQNTNFKTFFENKFGSSVKLLEFTDDNDLVQHQLLIGGVVLSLTHVEDTPALEFTKVEDLSSPDFKPHHVMIAPPNTHHVTMDERINKFTFKHSDSVRHASFKIMIVYSAIWSDSHVVYIEIIAKDTLGPSMAFLCFRLEGTFLYDYDKEVCGYQTAFEWEPSKVYEIIDQQEEDKL